jgi:hypothetical protein
MTQDATHKDIYNQLKAILDGCDTIIDAIPFCNAYTIKYPHMKTMIVSYTDGKTYRDSVDIKTKQSILNDINLCDTRDAALKLFSKMADRTSDEVYKKTMERIAHKKHYHRIENKGPDIITHVSKKCPHCSHILNMHENTNYVICGYHNPSQGYDWNGCGRDWCFHCNKMLCKKWELHSLNLQMNRNHNDECCSKHALANGYKYPDAYCQCNNINIHRDHNNILKTIGNI